MGIRGTPEFRAAYEADAADIRAKGLQFLYSYMLQSGDAGPSEAFAENVGHLCGGGAGARWFSGYEDHFPRTLSHVKKLLASL